MKRLFLFALAFFAAYLLIAQVAFAQAVGADPATPSWLQKAINWTPDATASVIVMLGGVCELLLGLFKTDKPRRLAYLAAGIFRGISELLTKWGKILDAVLPQRLTPAGEKEKNSQLG